MLQSVHHLRETEKVQPLPLKEIALMTFDTKIIKAKSQISIGN